jgi:glyoxylase-like metal-dependent hydrolase (beta-lactamase superfamily II)
MAVKVTVGDAEVFALADGRHPFDLGWHYPSIEAAQWAAWDGPATLNFAAFLVRHAGRTALIDTGWGPEHEPPGGLESPAGLMDELASIGVAPGDVDVVALSHLHPDHIGWNRRFAGAPFLVAEAELDHYRSRIDAGDRIHPSIRAEVAWLSGSDATEMLRDGAEVIPGLRALASPGHTPGHTCFVLESAGETFVLLADTVHHPAVLHETGWVQSFDWDPPLARANRERLLDEVEREGWLAGLGHLPYPSLGRLVRDGGGRRVWEPADA